MNGWTVSWTNPALAVGALGLLAPYFVHLLTRRTPSTMVFPTVQFLKRAKASQSALSRLRDILLLLLRTAFVAALLLAFLKPVLRSQAMAGDEAKRQAAVIVVDTSLSMQYGGGAPFARAQQAVQRLLDRFGTDCPANVVFAGVTPSPSLDAPATNTAPLRRDVLSAAPGVVRADVDAAVAEAVRELEAYPDRARTIYLVSDFQRTNWSAAKFAAVPEEIKIVFLPVSERTGANTAVTDITIRPRTPVESETVDIVCTIANYGGAAADVPVTLDLRRIAEGAGGMPDQPDSTEKTISVAAGSSGTANFRFRAAHTGSIEGAVRLPNDALDADNARFFTLDVRDRIDVLLVSDAVTDARSSAHFVWRALDPYGGDRAATRQAMSAIRTRVVRARDMDLTADPPQVLVIDGPGALPEKAVAQIAAYIADGGAAVYFLSDALDKGNLDAMAFAAKENYAAPFSIASMIEHASDRDAAVLSEVKMEDPIFRRFKDTGDIAHMNFQRYFATERTEGRGEVLARYADGNFAMGKASLGAGVLLLCNFSAGRDASDLAQLPAFIPLIHELAKSVRPHEGAAGRAVVGFPASGTVLAAGPDSGLMILSPSGKTVSATTVRHGNSLGIVLAAALECGFYRINDGSHHIGTIPVNVDARESDLLPLTEAQLHELAAAPGRKIASTQARSARAIGELLEGVPLWPYLLLAALGLLAIEQAALIALKR